MSDNSPSQILNKKRLSVHVSEMQLSLERLDLRKMEIQEETRKIDENIAATNAEIQKTQSELAKLL